MDDLTFDDADGGIFYDIIRRDGSDFFVVEWKNAQFSLEESDDRYSFQVWLGLGENQSIAFNYLSLADQLPRRLTVGASDEDGLLGVNHYYHFRAPSNPDALPIGTAPTSNSLLNVDIAKRGKLNLRYLLAENSANEAIFSGVEDAVQTAVNETATIDILANDRLRRDKKVPLVVDVKSDFGVVSANNQLKFSNGKFDLDTLTLVEQPTNGKVRIATDGQLLYKPAEGFEGVDSFTYQVSTTRGLKTQPVTVTVTVGNPAPVTPEPVAKPEEAPTVEAERSSGGGSVSWFLGLLLISLSVVRRNNKQA